MDDLVKIEEKNGCGSSVAVVLHELWIYWIWDNGGASHHCTGGHWTHCIYHKLYKKIQDDGSATTLVDIVTRTACCSDQRLLSFILHIFNWPSRDQITEIFTWYSLGQIVRYFFNVLNYNSAMPHFVSFHCTMQLWTDTRGITSFLLFSFSSSLSFTTIYSADWQSWSSWLCQWVIWRQVSIIKPLPTPCLQPSQLQLGTSENGTDDDEGWMWIVEWLHLKSNETEAAFKELSW